tara:strand:- start:13 stop:147 length:135 start_codon:yes stop_codon:yes gene_type:complete
MWKAEENHKKKLFRGSSIQILIAAKIIPTHGGGLGKWLYDSSIT